MDPVIDEPLREAAEIAGDRWMLLALGALIDGPRRFGDLVDDLGGIAPNVLIDRLRRMERHGLVGSTLYSQRPRRFVYDLTDAGRELAAIPARAVRVGGQAPRRGTATSHHLRHTTRGQGMVPHLRDDRRHLRERRRGALGLTSRPACVTLVDEGPSGSGGEDLDEALAIFDRAPADELASLVRMRAPDVGPVLRGEHEHVVLVVACRDHHELPTVDVCMPLEMMGRVPAQVVRSEAQQRHQVVPRSCPALDVSTLRLHARRSALLDTRLSAS
jgi:DNA-binding HxlR family transcriptional regulator